MNIKGINEYQGIHVPKLGPGFPFRPVESTYRRSQMPDSKETKIENVKITHRIGN